MWEIIGCGGHITKLRRTKVGIYNVQDATQLDDIIAESIFPVERIFAPEKYIELNTEVLTKINNGLIISWSFNFPLNTDLFIRSEEWITNIVSYDWEYLKAKRRI
jgi:tRNA U55 pseudouridine synthase TruB